MTPRGLRVELWEHEGDELALFAWDTGEPTQDAELAKLTAAERAVFAHVIAGASNAEIARARDSAVRTIANQVVSILRKLNASSRFELIRRYGSPRADRAAP